MRVSMYVLSVFFALCMLSRTFLFQFLAFIVISHQREPSPAQDDPRMAATCQVSGKFDKSFRCYVTPGMQCEGRVHGGQGSVCVGARGEGGRHEVYRCSGGMWRASVQGKQVAEFGLYVSGLYS